MKTEPWGFESTPTIGETLQPLERALALSEEHLRQGCFATSEAHLAQLHAEAHQLYSLALAWPDEARVTHLALSAALLRKRLSLEGLSHLSRTLSRELKEEDRQAFERLRALRTELFTLRLAGPGTRSRGDYERRLETLAIQGDTLEEDLARRSALLRWIRGQPPATELPSRVAAALPRDGALVEFVAFRSRPLTAEPAPCSAQAAGQSRYLALLLLADGSTHCVDLGPAVPIDASAILLHRALAGHAAWFQPAARALYASTVRPLLSLLGTVRQLFIAPDGWLALVPFTELHDGSHFLTDVIGITQISSGQDLLPGPEGLPRRRPALFQTSLGLDSPPEP